MILIWYIVIGINILDSNLIYFYISLPTFLIVI